MLLNDRVLILINTGPNDVKDFYKFILSMNLNCCPVAAQKSFLKTLHKKLCPQCIRVYLFLLP